MNFDLSEDEEMLKAAVERFAVDHYSVEKRRSFLSEENGFSVAGWHALAELGVLAAAFPEDQGGLGIDATGIAVIFEALGYGLVVEPVIENALVAGLLAARSGNEAIIRKWIDSLASGAKRLALAHRERGLAGHFSDMATVAVSDGEKIILNGEKPYVVAGGGCDGFIVSAKVGSTDGAWSLYLVPADSRGLQIRPWRMADGSMSVGLSLTDVALDADSELHDGPAIFAQVMLVGNLARSAEAVGIMRRLFDDTLDYLRQRTQFGAAIGSFQAIQHRMAEQYARIEQSRALLDTAILAWGSGEFDRAVNGARAFICEASLELGHNAIQFHGGMGITDELAIGQGHKRLLVLSRWPDTATEALDRFANV